ncbi:hypothetical protein MEBOL_006368 [Melittangium boletus DSM 14713]|uniref:Uncharacterized protein n=1 Tax=Melittangium boletus DSM 14713 TaxID=1294270 RepID=A0A250IMA3_9BACT|nr:hypothetical protein MEBOL_006368 [Melittangium boletus DSM 14713]
MGIGTVPWLSSDGSGSSLPPASGLEARDDYWQAMAVDVSVLWRLETHGVLQ